MFETAQSKMLPNCIIDENGDIVLNPLSRVLYVDTNASGVNADGSIADPFNTINAAQAAISDATLLNPYTLLLAGDDTNVPTAFKDFVYFKGAGVAETTNLKGDIIDNGAYIMLVNNVNILDNWTLGNNTNECDVALINTFVKGSISVNSVATGSAATVFNGCDFATATSVLTKIFFSSRNLYRNNLTISSANVSPASDMVVNMHDDDITGILSFITIISRPMTARLTDVRVASPVNFSLIAGANLTLILDDTSYTSMREAGTDFNIPNLTVKLTFDATISETFAAKDIRFNGELGVPSTDANNNWTDDTAGGSSTITLINEIADNVLKDLVLYTAISGGACKSSFPMTAEEWDEILFTGGNFSFDNCRIEDDGTNNIFAGSGFSIDNDPRNGAGVRSRIGITISENSTFTTIKIDGNSEIVLDGAGGLPTVLVNELMSGQIAIAPTPDGGDNFGAATLFIRGIEVDIGAIVSAINDAVTDIVAVNRSSGSGSKTFTFGKFGMTVYQEPPIKLLETITMQAETIQLFTPFGIRNYIVTLPNDNPRARGAKLEINPSNIGGNIVLTNEFLADPENLYNDLKTLTLNIATQIPLIGTNIQDQANNYVGFLINNEEGGAYTMSGVSVTTPIAAANTPIKVVTGGADIGYNLEGFEHSDNRLTKTIAGEIRYLIIMSMGANNAAGGSNDGRFHLFKNGVELPQPVSDPLLLSNNQFDSGSVSALVTLDQGEFTEVFIENLDTDDDINTTDLNVTITEWRGVA